LLRHLKTAVRLSLIDQRFVCAAAASMAQRSGQILGLHDYGQDGFHLDPLAAQFRNGAILLQKSKIEQP
jgi:hypothetical protein